VTSSTQVRSWARLRRWPDAMALTITVFEGGRVDIPSTRRAERVRGRLLGTTVGGRQAFGLRRGAVYAKDLVGAVDVGDLRVEVLPKPFGVETSQDARQLMFDLLRWAGSDIRPGWLSGGSEARNTDLLQVVEQRAADELLRRLEVGAPRRYQEVRERSPVLRGRIQFGEYARQLPSDAHLLPVRYSPLIADNDLGRLLKALATRLRDRSDTYRARRDLDRCLDLLAGVQTRPLTPELVRRVRLGRMEADWQGLVELAELLASGRSPDPTGIGETRQATLMFPMNRLFESAIRRLLAGHLPPPVACVRSPGEHALLRQDDGASSFSTALAVRPDLLFRASGVFVAAGDAKWKRLSESPPRYSILPADVYQLLAYMRLFRVSTGILFFPRADWMSSDWGAEFLVAPGHAERIKVLSVDLSGLVGGSAEVRKGSASTLARRVMAALPSQVAPSARPDGMGPDLLAE
jgi:5-methylcytosine-specific restriction enzyme subunit McrC